MHTPLNLFFNVFCLLFHPQVIFSPHNILVLRSFIFSFEIEIQWNLSRADTIGAKISGLFLQRCSALQRLIKDFILYQSVLRTTIRLTIRIEILWNLSKVDTIGTKISVSLMEMFRFKENLYRFYLHESTCSKNSCPFSLIEMSALKHIFFREIPQLSSIICRNIFLLIIFLVLIKNDITLVNTSPFTTKHLKQFLLILKQFVTETIF